MIRKISILSTVIFELILGLAFLLALLGYFGAAFKIMKVDFIFLVVGALTY